MKWDRRLKLLRVTKYLIAILLILAVALAGFTLYGNKIGNFVMYVDSSKDLLSISENEDRSKPTTMLMATALDKQIPDTLTNIKIKAGNLSDGIGSKNDTSVQQGYMAYSFYLINVSDTALNYRTEITITDKNGRLDEAIRVMFIENDFERETIYGKAESYTDEQYIKRYGATRFQCQKYEYTNFYSDTKIMSEVTNDFPANSFKKITIVMWAEGWDLDCEEEIVGSNIKMRLDFTAI